MEKMITGVLFDGKNRSCDVVEVEKNPEEYGRLLECEAIDITARRLDGTLYNLICDGEAFLKEEPYVSAIDGYLKPVLAGKLLILGCGDDLSTRSLTGDDIEKVMDCGEAAEFLILE